jgi:Sec-independent protein translocase protein TatA
VDTAVVLIIILIAVIVWRGPKTLPQLGAMFGRGVKEARRQVDNSKSGTDEPER